MWGEFRGFFGGTLPDQHDARVSSIEYNARSIPVVRLIHGNDYERQAEFWEARDSYEITYDWLAPIGVAKNPQS